MAPPKKDEDEDDKIDMKEVVRLAKNKPVSFAMAPGKDGLVFLAHKRKEPPQLALKVKKDGGEGAKLVSGTVSVRGSELVLQTNDRVTPAIIKMLRELLKSQKVMLKPTAPGVKDEDEGEDGPDPAKLKALLAALTRQQADIARQVKELGKKLGGGDAELADTVKKFEQVLKQADDKVIAALDKAVREADGEKRGKLAKQVGLIAKEMLRLVNHTRFKTLESQAQAPVSALGPYQKAIGEAAKSLA